MATRQLSRKKAHRQQMLRNLTTSVILYDRVVTTVAKAKEVRRLVDGVINLGKNPSLASRRKLLTAVADRNAAKKIWELLAPRYAERPSGYTRLVHMGMRHGDSAETMMIELISETVKTDVVAAAEVEKSSDKPVKARNKKTTVTVRRKGETK